MSLELGGNGWGRGFLAHFHPPWGYDEPELLRFSNRQFGPIGADAGRGERRLATDAAQPAASDEVKALRLQSLMISAGLEPSVLFYQHVVIFTIPVSKILHQPPGYFLNFFEDWQQPDLIARPLHPHQCRQIDAGAADQGIARWLRQDAGSWSQGYVGSLGSCPWL